MPRHAAAAAEQAAVACLEATNFTFLFAPAYHPAMKAVVPIRGALCVRTVFNILGPLTNPAAPPFQLIGAYSQTAAKLMADTLAGMPLERAFVVHGEPGWDEATPAGEFHALRRPTGPGRHGERTPEDYGLERCRPEDLAGGDAAHNASELVRVFSGEDKGAHRDALLMGTSLVLEVQGEANDATRRRRAGSRRDRRRPCRGAARHLARALRGPMSDFLQSMAPAARSAQPGCRTRFASADFDRPLVPLALRVST